MKTARFAQTTIHAEIIKTTEKAILILIDGGERWVPRAVCLEGDGLEAGDSDVIIADWWLEREGML